MAEPNIAARFPKKVTLEQGTYFWCACGLSNNQPFCDGSHKGSEFSPVIFKIDEKQDAWLCQCKQSSKKPFCDGTHKTLQDE
jgi:CDGSH iron-sulfur domain-containing protein 3